MKLVRYDYPKLLNGADHWFETPGWGLEDFSQLFRRMGNLGVPSTDSGRLATDVYEDDEQYYVRFELPGVKKGDLRVELEGELLTVSAEASSECEKRSAKRAIRLPEGVDGEKITAKLEDGVLTVSLGKAEAIKPKKIEVI